MKKYFLLIILFLLFITTGCRSKIELTVDVDSDIILKTGEQKRITAKVQGAMTIEWSIVKETTKEPLTLTVSNDIRSVSVLGKNEGMTVIEITVKDYPNLKKQVNVYVNNSPSLSINGSNEINPSEELKLTVDSNPPFLKDDIEWSISDETIATVDNSGLVKALKPGKVTIIATSNLLDIKGKVIINVTGPYKMEILGKGEVIVGENNIYNHHIYDTDNQEEVTWSVSDESIAVITKDGILRALKPGSFSVYAKSTTSNLTGELKVSTVIKPTEINITGPSKIYLKDKANLDYNTIPSNASKEVIITSSNQNIISVNENNELYAVNKGKVLITVTSVIDSTIKSSILIEVIGSNVEISGDDGVTINASKQYSVNGNINNTFIWESSNPSIATVNPSTGVVMGVSYGEVTIKAKYSLNNNIYCTKTIKVYDIPTEIKYLGPSELSLNVSSKVLIVASNSNGNLVDQNAFNITSNNPNIINYDLKTKGIYLYTLTTGEASILIESTVSGISINETIKVKANIDFHESILVNSKILKDEAIYYKSKTYVEGYNAFSNLDLALKNASEGTTIFIINGSYEIYSEVKVNYISLIGDNATIINKIKVNNNVKGLTIENLNFTKKGQIEMDENGGIEDFTFKNNLVYDSQLDGANYFISFSNTSDIPNKDFQIINNKFIDCTDLNNNYVKYIKGGNIINITITGNYFEGKSGSSREAIRIEGTSELDYSGIGAAGVVKINNNYFYNIKQRGIFITRYSATKIDINNNVFDWAGDIKYGGPVQLNNWNEKSNTIINIKYNTFKNVNAWYAIGLVNDSIKDTSSWKVYINYNKFTNFIDPLDGVCDFVLANSSSAKNLIDAEYNYFDSPIDNRFVNVGKYIVQFEKEEDLNRSIILGN